uniref:Uncharacterized protein n=1 Tax=Magallana gigas TaxID=29159 RepID=K1R4L7_MAGGI
MQNRSGTFFSGEMSQIVGFGMMDAEAMVSLAKTWTLVDQQLYCASETKNVNKNINNSRDVSKTTISELTSSIKETATLISWRLHFYGITKVVDNAKTPDIQKINDNSSTTAVAIAVTVLGYE